LSYIAQEHRNICVVGDDDQSIYGWRGADVGIILDFQEHFSGRLGGQARAATTAPPAKIIEAANSDHPAERQNRAEKKLWTANDPGENIIIYEAINEEEEAEWAAHTIETAGYGAPRALYGDYAILYRVNAASRNFRAGPRRAAGCPYQIVGGLRFYERAEIKDALAYLRALLQPCGQPRPSAGSSTLPRAGSATARWKASPLAGERNNCSLLDACLYFAANEDESRLARAPPSATSWDMMMLAATSRGDRDQLPDLVRAVVENSGMIDKLQRVRESRGRHARGEPPGVRDSRRGLRSADALMRGCSSSSNTLRSSRTSTRPTT
jgi:DNA helicase-2/ATP-dependent DNA helicase PcrA